MRMSKVGGKIHSMQYDVLRDIVRTPPTNGLWHYIAKYFNRTSNFGAGIRLANRKNKL